MGKKLVVDLSGRNGLVQNTGQNERQSYVAEDGQILSGAWNPFRRYGYASPVVASGTSVTVDQAQSAQMVARAYDAVNDDFYFAEAGRQIWKGDTMSDTSLERVIQLAASGGVISDLGIYTVNDVRKIFVMYRDNADTAEIAISSLPYDTATDNETFTATAGGDNIGSNSLVSGSQYQDFFMEVADNGFAYFFMANQVHKFDGTAAGGANGTMSANVLLFPAHFRIVDALDKGGFLFIGLHQYNFDTRNGNPSGDVSGPTQCGVYVWDRQSTVVSTTDYIPLAGVQEISKLFVGANGSVRALVRMVTGMASIIEISGGSYRILQNIGYSNHAVLRDSCDQFGQMFTWFSKGGELLMYGPPFPGANEGLFRIFSTGVASTSSGVIAVAKGTSSSPPAIYMNYQASGPTTTRVRLPVYTMIGQYGSDTMSAQTLRYPVSFLPQQSLVNYVDFYFANGTATGSTSTGTVSVYVNGSTTPFCTKTITRDMLSRGYAKIPIQKAFIQSVQFEVTYPGSTAISTSDLAPAFAIVDYEPGVDTPMDKGG